MSAASYNRGTAALIARLDAEARPNDARLLDDLSSVSAANDGAVPFGPTVVRITARGEACLMNKEETGWRSSCYSYRSLWEFARYWRVVFTGIGRDEHSLFFRVVPVPRTVQP